MVVIQLYNRALKIEMRAILLGGPFISIVSLWIFFNHCEDLQQVFLKTYSYNIK